MELIQKTKPEPSNTSVSKEFTNTLLGNEAIAFGLFDQGVRFAASYPGTPSTEIMELLIKIGHESDLIASWSTNEAVAFEEAAATAITGSFGVDVAVMATTKDTTDDTDTPDFDTDNSADETVPATTAGKLGELQVTLSNNDSLTALDLMTIRLNRNAAVASDAVGDIEVVAVTFEYTTT